MRLNRTTKVEWLDDLTLDEAERQQAVVGLSRINRVSGIADVLFHQLQRFAAHRPKYPLRVLDLASGAADLPIQWASKAKQHSVLLQITASDAREDILQEQQRAFSQANVTIGSLRIDCLRHSLPSGFDVIVCSHLMHRLEGPQVFRLLQSMQQATGRGLMVCDFERTCWNLAIAKTASRLLTRSRVLQHDTATGIKAAYTRDEFAAIANAALCRPIRIRPIVPCRFLAVADETVVPLISPAFA